MNNKITKQEFEESIKNHKMEIIYNDGLYRHIRYKKPDTINMYFDIITWPGSLCYTGDMGTYVFSRLRDMFEFFDRDHISFSYWAEKLTAIDRCDQIYEFDINTLKQNIYDIFYDEFCLDNEIEDIKKEEVLDELNTIFNSYDDEWEIKDMLSNVTYNGEKIFYDLWEINAKVYTYRYVWCCFAIQWGIKQYFNRETSA